MYKLLGNWIRLKIRGIELLRWLQFSLYFCLKFSCRFPISPMSLSLLVWPYNSSILLLINASFLKKSGFNFFRTIGKIITFFDKLQNLSDGMQK